MTDTQIAANVELAATVAPPIRAEGEQWLPLGLIVFGGLALVAADVDA